MDAAPAKRKPDPRRSEINRANARARWGHDHVPRTLHIEDLTEAQRRLVVAFVNAQRSQSEGA